MIRTILLWSLIGFIPLSAAAAPKVHEYTLDNGLKLIVKEDHRAPVVVSQVWYKVGSSYEHNGTTGMSHALEHMMFKGTKKHPAGEFSRIIAANGGEENAFTSRDYTAYFQKLEAKRLKISFQLEADRMRNLLLRKKDFAKEIRVVMEERRLRTEDRPTALTYERFLAAAFISNPYRIPTIGWMDDLTHLKAADLRNWYHHWYGPNNATLVVVGDVNPEHVYTLAKKYFGPVPRIDVVAPRPQVEPPERGTRRITVKAPAQLPYLIMGYHVPVLKTAKADWEPYALEVLGGILAGGDSARLPSRLVRGSGVATSADAGYDLYSRMGDLFLFDGVPAQGKTPADLEQAIRAQIKDLQDKPVTAAELERVKAQVVAGNVFQRDSVFYQAMQIGMLESVGLDWRVGDKYVERIRAVTPEQVQAVAKKYLNDDRLTVAVLDPQPMGNKRPRPMMPELEGHSDVR